MGVGVEDACGNDLITEGEGGGGGRWGGVWEWGDLGDPQGFLSMHRDWFGIS